MPRLLLTFQDGYFADNGIETDPAERKAFYEQRKTMISKLLARKINVRATNNKSQTAVEWAQSSNKNTPTELIQFLEQNAGIQKSKS